MRLVRAFYGALFYFMFRKEFYIVETRIAIVGIIVENPDSVEALNRLLHEYAHAIIGRMGIPCRERSINVISLVLDAKQDEISALSGKIGALDGITTKTTYSKM